LEYGLVAPKEPYGCPYIRSGRCTSGIVHWGTPAVDIFLPYSLGAAVQLLTTISSELFVRELKTVLFARSHSSKARSTALALKRLINGVTFLLTTIRPHGYAKYKIWPTVTDVAWSVCLSVGDNRESYKNR